MTAQRVVEELTGELGRSVVLVGMDREPIAWSCTPQHTQDLWSRGVEPGAYVRTVLRGMQTLTVPLRERVGADDPGEPGWMAVPVASDGVRAGMLLIGGDDELSGEELALIDSASMLAFDVLATIEGRSGDRGRTMRGMLAADESRRQESLQFARSRDWIDAFSATHLHVLVFDPDPGVLRRTRLAQAIARSIPVRAEALGEFEGFPVIVTRSSHDDDVDQLIVDAAATHGIPLRGSGSAALTADDDPAAVASAARIAADVSIAVPEASRARHAEQLGGWALLHSVARSRTTLALASPAAEALCALTDKTRRETVEVYLDVAGSPREACARLHIHRATLYYRLEHLPAVVRDALADGLKRSTLHLALKLDRLWSATGVA